MTLPPYECLDLTRGYSRDAAGHTDSIYSTHGSHHNVQQDQVTSEPTLYAGFWHRNLTVRRNAEHGLKVALNKKEEPQNQINVVSSRVDHALTTWPALVGCHPVYCLRGRAAEADGGCSAPVTKKTGSPAEYRVCTMCELCSFCPRFWNCASA